MCPKVAGEANLGKKASPTGRAEAGSAEVGTTEVGTAEMGRHCAVGAGDSDLPGCSFLLSLKGPCAPLLCGLL